MRGLPRPVNDARRKPRGRGGVSCVECHRYHNGDHPAQGIGARARLGKAEMAVDQFLSGGPPARAVSEQGPDFPR